MAFQVVGMVIVATHMTTDPLTAVAAASIDQEAASPAATASRYDQETEVGIKTATAPERTVDTAGETMTGKDTMKLMATTILANEDIKISQGIHGLSGGFLSVALSTFPPCISTWVSMVRRQLLTRTASVLEQSDCREQRPECRHIFTHEIW